MGKISHITKLMKMKPAHIVELENLIFAYADSQADYAASKAPLDSKERRQLFADHLDSAQLLEKALQAIVGPEFSLGDGDSEFSIDG